MPESTAQALARHLSMVPWLLTHPGISLGEAAAHFGRTRRQMERDVLAIAEVGDSRTGETVEFDWDLWEEERRILVRRSYGLDLPPRLTDAEASAILVGLAAIAPGLDDRLRARIPQVALAVRALAGGTQEDPLVVSGQKAAPGLAAIGAALEAGESVSFEYVNAAGKRSTRHVDPEGVRLTPSGWMLHGWCRAAAGLRRFRLDRVENLRRDGPAESHEALQETQGSGPEMLRLTVDLGARWLADVFDATLVAEDHESVTVELPVWDEAWVSALVIDLVPHLRHCEDRWHRVAARRAAVIRDAWAPVLEAVR
ncbi:WYL domain-containing protein [Schaalia sp. 19OD2882]|uniref:helix-turn-helix transcriptional regulator n=1 Tax=Schaalia sp. 19OD2882 TaxID=2794089 RepID=UPI001C1EBDC0|nr:WYL domain-containing protein [Schaalia sp. 19OD2882]QWW18686.1 WYL domain-containing protein [Schaalia sp. 19OD2882]